MKRLLLAFAALALCPWACADILIGQTTGITGNSAANVKETTAGSMLLIDAVNARGGVHGQQIRILALDDKGDTKLAVANARTLVKEDHVLALFMVRGTPQNMAILPLLEQESVPMVAPSTGAMVLHTPVKPWVFNVRSSYQSEAEKAIVLLGSMGISRVAVLKTNDPFGNDAVQGAERGFEKTGVKPVFIEPFDKGRPDFAAIAPRLVAADVQAVMVLGTGASVVSATRAVRQAGSKATIVTLSNNASGGFVQELGEYARGVVVTQVFPSERSLAIPMIKEANDMLRAKDKNAELTPAMIEGFAAAKVLVEGLRRAGDHPTRAGLQKALEGMQKADIGGLEVSYGPHDHTGLDYADLSIIGPDGKFRR